MADSITCCILASLFSMKKRLTCINMLYKMMPLDMADILNYIAATYLTDYLAVSQTGAAAADSAAAAAMPKAVRRKAAEPAHKEGRRGHSADDDDTEQPKKEGGLLSRLMKRLLSK